MLFISFINSKMMIFDQDIQEPTKRNGDYGAKVLGYTEQKVLLLNKKSYGGHI
jgi:hypothetical protein